MSSEHLSLAEIVGPWQEPASLSGLVDRVRQAWTKPIRNLTNHELATCLRQAIAVEHLLSVAKQRAAMGVEDGSEIDDAELSSAVANAEYREQREAEHRRIMSTSFRTDEKSA